jgi:hypothetical protein
MQGHEAYDQQYDYGAAAYADYGEDPNAAAAGVYAAGGAVVESTRFSWGAWPSTKLEASRLVVPIACAYAPLSGTDTTSRVEYEAVRCKGQGCGAVMNPYW